MKVFISGPIENMPPNRLRRFEEAKQHFENEGFEVVTEIDVPYPELKDDMDKMVDKCNKEPDLVTWLFLSMKKVWLMSQCDALFLLPKWQECHACEILSITAKKLAMPIYIDDGSTIKLANESEVRDWFESQMV